jgi:N-ethylmaleimide reductase
MQLFTPIRVGRYELKNRVVMSPMARARNGEDRAPTQMVADYYAQRVTAGLIVTEASSVSRFSVSRPHTSAIYADLHTAGWRNVAKTVHAKGGLIFQQLYHLGRKCDPSRMPDGVLPVAPSAIAAIGHVHGLNGQVPFATPRPLETDEIPGIVDEFRRAAMNAQMAGMDGIEIHGANGYLIDEFLRDGSNKRTDRYGGSAANRARFLIEVAEAVIGVFGADRIGVRFSPQRGGDGIDDSDPAATFGCAAAAMRDLKLAYVHMLEPRDAAAPIRPAIRKAFGGPLIVNSGYTRKTAEDVIAAGDADMVAFGSLYIANPDLVERFRRNAPLNPPDTATFHNGSAKGYIDYPMLDQPAVAGA